MLRRLTRCAAAAALAGAACGGSPTSEPGASPSPDASAAPAAASCSAASLDAVLPPQDVPEAVAATRTAIAEAAVACDYERLERITRASANGFNYSFGESGSPGAFWREREQRGEKVLATLVRLLRSSHGRVEETQPPLYVWPAVAASGAPSDDDWKALESVFPPEQVAEMRGAYDEHGGYFGYRAGVSPAGDWIFFVAGD